MSDTDEFLAHHGVKGMKWGVRKASSSVSKVKNPLQSKKSLSANPLVKLAKGTKGGNVANIVITAASVGAVAASAPISTPVLVGGVVVGRLAAKSYDAYEIFYKANPAPPVKGKPTPSASDMAKYKVGEDIRKQLTAAHGSTKMSEIKKGKQS